MEIAPPGIHFLIMNGTFSRTAARIATVGGIMKQLRSQPRVVKWRTALKKAAGAPLIVMEMLNFQTLGNGNMQFQMVHF